MFNTKKRILTGGLLVLMMALTTSCGKLTSLANQLNDAQNQTVNTEQEKAANYQAMTQIAEKMTALKIYVNPNGVTRNITTTSMMDGKIERADYPSSQGWYVMKSEWNSPTYGKITSVTGSRPFDQNRIILQGSYDSIKDRIFGHESFVEMTFGDNLMFHGDLVGLKKDEFGGKVTTFNATTGKEETVDLYKTINEGSLYIKDLKKDKIVLNFPQFKLNFTAKNVSQETINKIEATLDSDDYEGNWVYNGITTQDGIKEIMNECIIRSKKSGKKIGKILFKKLFLDYEIVMD